MAIDSVNSVLDSIVPFPARKLEIMNGKLKSRKLWVTILTTALITLLTALGFDEESVTKIAGVAGAYLLGQGIADHGKERGISDKMAVIADDGHMRTQSWKHGEKGPG